MENTGKVLLDARNLWKSYGKGEARIDALADVSLQIFDGELLTILGSSGSGKSTLLNALGGMDKPDRGKIIVNGKDLCKMNDRALTDYRRKNIGFVFQSFNLIAELTTKENIAMTADTAHNPHIVEEVFDMVGLREKMNNYPSQLSGGQQQRISIARALAKNPQILLCDEPTGALDSETGVMILKLLLGMAKSYGKTIVIVTHNQSIAKMADTIIRVKNGKIRSVEEQDKPMSADEVEW